MRLLIQRVSQASVAVDAEIVGRINEGLLVFLGIHKDDTEESVDWLVKKLVHLRIFEDGQGKMNLSIQDVRGEILLISQFTLYANCLSGRRPDFISAAPPSKALPLYERFIIELKKYPIHVQTGEFGARMKVSLTNEGPATFILDTP